MNSLTLSVFTYTRGHKLAKNAERQERISYLRPRKEIEL